MNITDEEIKALEASKNEREWNAECDKIKRARDGQYPPDWWPKVSQSGLMHRVAASWVK